MHSCDSAVCIEGIILGTLKRWSIALLVGCCLSTVVWREPATLGNMRLRNDLQVLNDSGVIKNPLTALPFAWGDGYSNLADIKVDELTPEVLAEYDRVRQIARDEIKGGFSVFEFAAAAGGNLRVVRNFEDTLREEGEIAAGFGMRR